MDLSIRIGVVIRFVQVGEMSEHTSSRSLSTGTTRNNMSFTTTRKPFSPLLMHRLLDNSPDYGPLRSIGHFGMFSNTGRLTLPSLRGAAVGWSRTSKALRQVYMATLTEWDGYLHEHRGIGSGSYPNSHAFVIEYTGGKTFIEKETDDVVSTQTLSDPHRILVIRDLDDEKRRCYMYWLEVLEDDDSVAQRVTKRWNTSNMYKAHPISIKPMIKMLCCKDVQHGLWNMERAFIESDRDRPIGRGVLASLDRGWSNLPIDLVDPPVMAPHIEYRFYGDRGRKKPYFSGDVLMLTHVNDNVEDGSVFDHALLDMCGLYCNPDIICLDQTGHPSVKITTYHAWMGRNPRRGKSLADYVYMLRQQATEELSIQKTNATTSLVLYQSVKANPRPLAECGYKRTRKLAIQDVEDLNNDGTLKSHFLTPQKREEDAADGKRDAQIRYWDDLVAPDKSEEDSDVDWSPKKTSKSPRKSTAAPQPAITYALLPSDDEDGSSHVPVLMA